jgi:hypothetical protein
LKNTLTKHQPYERSAGSSTLASQPLGQSNTLTGDAPPNKKPPEQFGRSKQQKDTVTLYQADVHASGSREDKKNSSG